ncbi:MAG: response regulator transcription factor [Chloroflexi bacterium]|nr:response regulator transcription factor [Chloroflexota bacterium]
MINIVIVDDHPVVREGLSAMLSTQDDMQVLAEASTGAEAISMSRDHDPDVMVVDLQLPDMDGSDAIEKIRDEQPDSRFLVLTSYDTDDRVLRAIRAGAQGYLLKGVPKEELFQAVRTIHRGGSLLGPGVAPKLLSRVQEGSQGPDVSRLTERELEILRLVADGFRNKEIAVNLMISERTVKFHVSVIFQKLEASSRTEAVRAAVRKGLIQI